MTSLTAQLQRLATPQTSTLVESKSRYSILYESKDAAKTDRQTIFDQSKSGLEELISKNSAFSQFKNTLFDESTINLERSVETAAVQKTLNENIRKFLLHLSPYFLVKPAHYCLEWLIRRYRINEYNIDDMLALILPYHETMIFVKCLQTIPFTNDKSRWYWLKGLQKPGIALPKPEIIKRAVSDAQFLKFIWERTSDAVKELQKSASTLHALFAFYATVTLGVFDKRITETHISHINGTLLRGLSSDVDDFRAASMIIAGVLMTKLEFENKFLGKVVSKLLENRHRHLTRDAIVLLILICETQPENTDSIAEVVLSQMIDNPSMLDTLADLNKEVHINVLPLCLPLIAKCLGEGVDEKKAEAYHEFVESLLSKLSFLPDDANAVIRCILKALKRSSQSDVHSSQEPIQIDLDDDDDVDMVGGKMQESDWHTRLLTKLDAKYSTVLDAVKDDIMKSQDDESHSLKIVLGALLCSKADPSGGASVDFVDLYHPNALNRQLAVKKLVNMKKLSSMPICDEKKNWLLVGITQHLSDESPEVVNEVLQFTTEDLIKIVGEQNLIKKLKYVIGNAHMTQKKWQGPIGSAIKHITSEHLLSNDNEIEIFLAIWPYMYPINEIISHHKKAIVKSGIASRFPIIKRLRDVKFAEDTNDVMECVNKLLENSFEKSRIGEIVQFVQTIPEEEMTMMSSFHIINLLTHSLPRNSDHHLSNGVFDAVTKLSLQCELTRTNIDEYAKQLYSENALRKLPNQLIVDCVQSIIERTNFSAVFESNSIDFTASSGELSFMIRLHRHICPPLFSSKKFTKIAYEKPVTTFIRHLLPDIDKQLDFYSNFFISHHIDQLIPIPIGAELQLLSIIYFNELLKRPDQLNEIKMEVFIRIISGLTSPFEDIRKLTCETIDVLFGKVNKSSKFSKFLGLLLNERETLSLSTEDLSLFMSNKKLLRTELFEFIRRPDSAMILKAALLDMLKLVDKDIGHLHIAVDVALDILNKTDCSQLITLNSHESMVVYQTIVRFKPERNPSIWSHRNCESFFEKVLQLSNVSIQIENKPQSVSVLAMNLIVFTNFKSFRPNLQKYIINAIVKSATFSKNSEVRSRAGKFFQKSIELDGKIELDILTEMAKVSSFDVARKTQLSQEVLQTSEWKCGVTVLEFLTKKRLTHPIGLMGQLFSILQKCFLFDEQSMVEYTKQLVLIDILNCCKSMSPNGSFNGSDFKVELVVICVQGTQNPQTHHHALQLLTQLAKIVPASVQDSIMQIFTFVGNSIVSREDAYIYQLVSNIIKSVVPILKERNIVEMLKEFCVIISDVPAHRRSALYEDLLKTLDPAKYLWMFLACLFETEVIQKTGTNRVKKTAVAIEITNLFDCDVIIKACNQLIRFLLAHLRAVDQGTAIEEDDFKGIFNAKNESDKYDKERIVAYTKLILNFVNVLTKDKFEFSTKMAAMDKESLQKHKKTFEKIITTILKYIKASSRSELQKVDRWNDGLSACYHILDHLLDLLEPDMLLQVVDVLLGEENAVEVRGKLLDLLNKKLAAPEVFVNCKDSILSLLEPLKNIVSTTETSGNSSLQKEALIAIKSLSRIVAEDHPEEFGVVVKILAKILSNYKHLTILMRTRLIECLGEICAQLRVHTVSHLYSFMPTITLILNEQRIDASTIRCFEIIFGAIVQITETVPRFLTPYLVELIKSLSISWSRLLNIDSPYSQNALKKLSEIWQILASTLELRVLIPMVESHIYSDLLNNEEFNATGPLMILLLESFTHSEHADVVQNSQELMKFFTVVMDFRSKYHRKCTTVDVQEDCFFKAIIAFVLQLSEGAFRPFYNSLRVWSNENVDPPSYDRSITFYRLSNKLAESLKSLFITFAHNIVEDAANLLKRDFTEANAKPEIEASSARPSTLVYNILSTLQTIFSLGDSFINSQRFDVLMNPLVNILDKEEYLMDDNINEILPKCLAQFATAANNDGLWKQLNQQILKKTQNNSVVIRRSALICSTEVITQLGEDSLQLYPELIPFFSELLEDDDTEIQTLCNRSITEIERATGEDLRKNL